MAYFRSLHSHLQVLSKEYLKGTRIEHGFKRAFMSLFGQDDDTFTSTMLLNVDQLQKQLNKDEFQEDRSMASFWVINRQFQQYINSQFTLDYDSQMTNKLGNDTYADDADIKSIYDEEPMTKVHLTAECNIFAIGQQHIENLKSVMKIQENVFAIAALKNDLGKLKGNSVDTKWVPTGKILASCTSKDDIESTHGSNVDIPNIHECKQTLDLSAVVSKSFAVTNADASDKRQQQPDSTSSTSTLATTVTVDGNFDL
ncbi:hypothetical protein Tco_1015663 [Tanacetum coccineum]|uniref:Uncharacterized protein n=1 Tax=Tanacetum coccineum TaxID=301880 RepID=A0ABQ5FLG3_9ASTR